MYIQKLGDPFTTSLQSQSGVLAETSTAIILIEGIPDGSHAIKIWSETTDSVIFDSTTTFTSGQASIEVISPAGVAFSGRWLGDTPPTTGTGVYGVTE